MKHEKFTITGMSCSACSARVEKAVNKLDGIDKASVNLLTNSMQASYDENVVSEQDIIQSSMPAMAPARLKAAARSRPVRPRKAHPTLPRKK